MTAPLGAGYINTAGDLRNASSNFARQQIQLNQALHSLGEWVNQRNVVPSGATITTLEQIFLNDYTARNASDPNNAANAHADYLQFMDWLNATMTDLLYATTQAGASGVGTTTVVDNTAGTAPVTLSVPVGAKGYTTSDHTLQSLHDGVGTDISPIINQVAPPQF